MTEVASHLLNFSDKKMRAVSSRAYRSVLPASNGSAAFNMGSTINFDLGSNQANTFYDFQNSYLEFTFHNKIAAGDINFDGNIGYFSAIRKIEILTSGITLFSLDNYNVLLSAFFDTDVGREYRNNQGAVLYGTTDSYLSQTLAATKKQTVVLPLFLLPIFSSNKYFPAFSRDGLQIRITLDSALKAATGTTANHLLANDTDIAVEDCKMIIYNVELNNEAMAAVNASTGGMYEIVCDSYSQSQISIPSTATSISSVLGFSYSSLNRVILVHRPQSTANGTNDSVGITNRIFPRLTELSLAINGEQFPQRVIKTSGAKIDNGGANTGIRGAAEVFAELYIADNAFGNVSHSGGFGDATNDAAATYLLGVLDNNNLEAAGTNLASTGRFLAAIDLESMRASDSDKMYSGQNCIGAVVSLNEKFDTIGVDVLLDVFAQYTMSIMLDMNTTGVFTVAV